MLRDEATASTSGCSREVGGAQLTPGIPQPTSGASPSHRLNPNAPVFVPDFQTRQVAKKLFDDLSPYTRWSTASSDETSYGPRYESIWREVTFQDHQRLPNPRFDYSLNPSENEVGELEFDEVQAMNIGAESYDPPARCSVITMSLDANDIVGDLQSPMEESLDEGKSNGFQIRRSFKPNRRCCLLM
ncbi:LOW QUALITY PROTEIN: uncharacterized protein LOC108118415 [Drosophila eugracilis]|uniref:LOW QUALITY PROTEIN: uncharacterized protein LOC108118415 n=1 Tax=Drosophila eugracilis TaxID=29029 RepID=UPI001BDB1AC1|nr:LOW QUALITY PROTEIN: uncharacterized protein LOC108118415 [Drosophila eugracilis]